MSHPNTPPPNTPAGGGDDPLRGADELVVRPDLRRYRRYFGLRWGLLVVVVAAFLVGAFFAGNTVAAVSLIVGTVALAIGSVISLRWRRRHYLDPNPVLILRADQFRIRHKGLDLWVPWADVESVRSYTLSRPGLVLDMIGFNLIPAARSKLPQQDAPLGQRLMQWRTNDLVYDRPCDTPPMDEVLQIADRLHDRATGGHRLRAKQQAHWPPHLQTEQQPQGQDPGRHNRQP